MEQTIRDGVGVQIDGDHNSVTLVSPAGRLVLDRRHLLKAPAENLRELLLTEKRATDLVGREGDLAVLQEWLAGKDPITCRCLIARAGTGKTRLAIELCEAAETQGWTAGFLRHDELQRFAEEQNLAGWRWGQDTLVVVDYAAASAIVLRKWLQVLARHSSPEKKLRLLLLERHADAQGGWWAELARPGGMSGPGPDDLLDPPVPEVLPSLVEVEARRALLGQTIATAARLAGVVPPTLPAPGANPDFDRRIGDDTIDNEPLYLLMAGLVALTTGVPAALSLGKLDLACRVAEAERSRLDRLAEAVGIDRSLFRHLAACLTLQGGCDRGAARALVEAEAAALGEAGFRINTLVEQLATALPLPGSPRIDAVRPDLIGESFVWMQLTGAAFMTGEVKEGRHDRGEQCEIVSRSFRRDSAGTVATVIRAAQNLAEGSAAHATVAWLAHVAELAADIQTLATIADALPDQTLALREQSADITARIVRLAREQALFDQEEHPTLAGWLNNLSVRQSELGDWEAALRSIQEAVDIRRALAAARPDAFRPDLAASLNNLSNRQAELGDREAALRSIQEAVDLYRALAAARPDAFRPDLALSLNNLSVHQSELGDREAALRSIQEAVDIRRALAATRPDAFRPNLARSLNNLSVHQSELGDREAALRSIKEAVDIYRALAAARPDAFRPDLALSLNNLSVHQSELGDREAALRSIQEAVDIRRALAATRPDAFRPNLARSLNNLSVHQSELGDREAALRSIKEAVDIYRALAAARPDAFRPDLARSLNNLSNSQADLGDREAALRSIQEAVDIRRALAAARPDAFRPVLAASLNNLSNCQSDLGDREAALRSIQEAVDLDRALAAARPDAFRPDLASSLNNLSGHQSKLGDREAALRLIQEAVDIYRALAAARPDAFRPNLAGSLNNLSNRQAALGDWEAALRSIQEAVDIYRALAAARPDAFRPDLAGSLNNLSNRQAALGDREAALRSIREAVDLYRPLAAARPEAFRSDLALSLWVLADRCDESADPVEGLAANRGAIIAQTPAFLRFPAAFAPRMQGMVQEYRERCEKLRTAPDEALLAPVIEALSRLEANQEETT